MTECATNKSNTYQSQAVDVRPLPRVEVVDIECVVEDFWCQVALGADFLVGGDIHRVRVWDVTHAEAQVGDG